MKNKEESLADVIAEMRRWIRQEGNRATWDWRPGNGWSEAAMRAYLENAAEEWKQLCDRLEAAAKREHGNAAAMRAAVAEVVRQMTNEITDLSHVPSSAGTVMALTWYRGLLKKAIEKPSRNCDRFADELDAQLAFLNEVWLISVDHDTMLERDKYENWTDEMKARYGRWLLAPASEKKGDVDEEA